MARPLATMGQSSAHKIRRQLIHCARIVHGLALLAPSFSSIKQVRKPFLRPTAVARLSEQIFRVDKWSSCWG
jgi:hypothetical protein